ncbi:hypothetical protein Agub_g12064 [Astrephomene gubernaculifera]|uniref:ethanolamine kinase n=1 Tax=Astrephomene gubernaculifera TaxID=47775 RepID=A0AAD3HR75_9CHLO|nr:hypothetical protein Agub_g12064 [Astrephomene gubernaculifera]
MQVSRISGGISNLLVKLQPPPPLQPVAVKVFGDKTELLIDREAEKGTLLRLNSVGFGAPVVGLFGNGRIEQFLIAKTLTPDEMADPRFVPHIARRLRAFHDLQLGDMPAAAGTTLPTSACTSAPGPATATASSVPPETGSPTSPSGSDSGSNCRTMTSQWDTIYAWLAMAEGLSFPQDPAKQAAYDKVDFGGMRSELAALREMCERVGSPRVFCHNDLLSGNILVVQHGEQQQQQGQGQQQQAQGLEVPSSPQQQQQEEEEEGTQARAAAVDGADQEQACTSGASSSSADDVLQGGELQFIDFEYSCYGIRGFDLGNHFNEYAGFDCDYGRFPTPQQQKLFFRHYLEPGELRALAHEHLRSSSSRSQPASTTPPAAAVTDAGAAAAVAAATLPSEADLGAAEEAVLDRLVSEACVYALVSHAYWGVWSFIQARYSPIEFDYMDYSGLRWGEYHRRKQEFFALVDRHFPK